MWVWVWVWVWVPAVAGTSGQSHAGASLLHPAKALLCPLPAGAGYAGGIVSSAVDGLRVGGTIAAELTGAAGGALDAAAFQVKSGY